MQVQAVQAGSCCQRHYLHSTAQPSLYCITCSQATVGDVEGTQPWAVQMEARAKWDAWNSVKGMAKEEAMKQYIDIVTKGDANWRVSRACPATLLTVLQTHAVARLLLIATEICDCIDSHLLVVCFCCLGLAMAVNKVVIGSLCGYFYFLSCYLRSLLLLSWLVT